MQDDDDAKLNSLVKYIEGLGLERLAEDIRETGFAGRIAENQRWLDSYAFFEAVEEKFQDSIEQRLVAMNSQMYDKAATYNNLVVSFGYAGFFAIWSLVKDGMHSWDISLVALLLGISLFLFIIWTITMVVFNARNMQQLGAVINLEFDSREEKMREIINLETKQKKKGLLIMSVWMPVFYSTVITGFAAGGLLLSLLFCQVLELDYSFYSSKEQLKIFFNSK